MANSVEIAQTYDWITNFFLDSFGANPDITGAMYNGDFSKSLEQAQADKYQYILEGIRFKPGDRIFDIGCGWGNMLAAIRRAGGIGFGVTLSPEQKMVCDRDGLKVGLQDYKTVDPNRIGKFDGITSIGAFEHFCSVDEYLDGKQELIYQQFFQLCHELLPKGGRLFLQTMMWGDKGVPDVKEMRSKNPKYSDYWYLGLLSHFYPGSWLPESLQQIQHCATPYFKLVSENNGTLDYIQTYKEWHKRLRKPTAAKFGYAFKLLPKLLSDHEFRLQISSTLYKSNMVCFERNIMTHQRMVFEKVA